jgi:hypothetical protein
MASSSAHAGIFRIAEILLAVNKIVSTLLNMPMNLSNSVEKAESLLLFRSGGLTGHSSGHLPDCP